MPTDQTTAAGRRPAIKIPKGGFATDEDEARWLEQTIVMRMGETFALAGINATVNPIGLRELLLRCMRSAAERATKELQATFDLRWDADMRAIKRWREGAPGRDLTLPDHADLCVWLLGQIETKECETRG